MGCRRRLEEGKREICDVVRMINEKERVRVKGYLIQKLHTSPYVFYTIKKGVKTRTHGANVRKLTRNHILLFTKYTNHHR